MENSDYDYKKATDDMFSHYSKPRPKPSNNPIFHRNAVAALINDVGTGFLDCTIENYQTNIPAQADFKSKIQEYIDNIDTAIEGYRQLFLYGKVGCGKDHLTMAVARAALEKGYKVRCISGPEFRAKVRESIGSESETEYLTPYVNCDFLWLSDPVISDSPMSSYQQDVLYRLVDSRWRNRIPTWVTINCMNAEGAARDLGGAVFDRLRHNAVTFFCDWKSARKKLENSRA